MRITQLDGGTAVHEMGLDMRRSVIGCAIMILQFAQGCSNPYTIDPSPRIKNSLIGQSPSTQVRRRAVRPSTGITNGLIAFTLRDRAGRLQIFTENLDGSNQRQLTFEGDNGRPDWSPDGRKIGGEVIRIRDRAEAQIFPIRFLTLAICASSRL